MKQQLVTETKMQTKEEVSVQFQLELQQLLRKYDAELTADDYYKGYPECGSDIQMVVTIPAEFNSEHDCMREYTEIFLGDWVKCG